MSFIACGPEHMMAIAAFRNDLYAWGNNIYGQLGVSNPVMNTKEVTVKEKTANDIRVFKPKQVPLIIGDYTLKVEMVALGMYHSVLLSVDKYIYSCGLKKYAGIPLSDVSQSFEYADTFTQVTNDQLRNRKFKMIASGEFHCLALSDSNDVYGWGSSLFGRLGLGEHYFKGGEEMMMENQINGLRRTMAEDSKLIMQPNLLFENKDGNAKRQMRFLACGPTHSASINKHGEAFTWGSAISGKLGVKVEELHRMAEKEEDKDASGDKKKKNQGLFVMPKTKVIFFGDKKSSNFFKFSNIN